MTVSSQHLESLKELINIGIGRSTQALDDMIDKSVSFSIPETQILPRGDLKTKLRQLEYDTLASIKIDFTGTFTGFSGLIFQSKGADKLVSMLLGIDENEEPDPEERKEAIIEVGNIILNSVVGTISNLTKSHFQYTVPHYEEGTSDTIFTIDSEKTDPILIYGQSHFFIDEVNLGGDIILLMEMDAVDSLDTAEDDLLI